MKNKSHNIYYLFNIYAKIIKDMADNNLTYADAKTILDECSFALNEIIKDIETDNRNSYGEIIKYSDFFTTEYPPYDDCATKNPYLFPVASQYK